MSYRRKFHKVYLIAVWSGSRDDIGVKDKEKYDSRLMLRDEISIAWLTYPERTHLNHTIEHVNAEPLELEPTPLTAVSI